MQFFFFFLYKTYINTPKMLFLFLVLYKTYTNTSKMSNNFDICIHFQQIPAYTACTLCITHKRETKTLRTSFSTTVELFLIKGTRLFIIFDFQQLLLLTNFDQTHGYGDCIQAMFLVYFFIFLHAVYRTVIAPMETLRTSFSSTVKLLLIGSPSSYIIFDFQQLLLVIRLTVTEIA